MRFGSMLLFPSLGGLWMASRDVLASHIRILRLGLFEEDFLFFSSRSFFN